MDNYFQTFLLVILCITVFTIVVYKASSSLAKEIRELRNAYDDMTYKETMWLREQISKSLSYDHDNIRELTQTIYTLSCGEKDAEEEGHSESI